VAIAWIRLSTGESGEDVGQRGETVEVKRGKKNNYIRGLRWFLVILGWTTILLNHIFLMNGLHHSYNFFEALFHGFKLFTIQSNILVLLSLSLALAYKKKVVFFTDPKVRTALAVYITVTMLIFFMVLRQEYRTTGMLHIIHVITHYIIPGGYLIDWFFTVDPKGYHWGDSLKWIIYPGIYGLFSLIYGRLLGEYAYPFLNLEALSGFSVALNFLLGLLGFLILGLIFIGIQKSRESLE